MIGKTRSPSEIARLAQQYNWRPTHCQLLWTPGDEVAERVLSVIRRDLASEQIEGGGANWYEMPHDVVINGLHGIAAQAGFRFFSTEERNQRHERLITDFVERRKALPDTRRSRGKAPGQVVPFTRR